MGSLKSIAKCIGVTGANVSLVRDFYGYVTGAPQTLSLLTQVRLLKGKHIHLNLIRVGIENFTSQHEQELDYAISKLREIYAQDNVRLGIGRIPRFFITEAQANQLGIFNSSISDPGQQGNLTDDFTGPDGALDVFYVLNIQGTKLGRSDVDGSCDKTYDSLFMTGSVVSMEGSGDLTARITGHEIGHYLGLSHPGGLGDKPFSLMTQFADISDKNKPLDSVHVSQQEGENMRDHCFVQAPC